MKFPTAIFSVLCVAMGGYAVYAYNDWGGGIFLLIAAFRLIHEQQASYDGTEGNHG